jgi:hypothetical protein
MTFVTLPHLDLPDIDVEAKETAARFAECRVIREGLDPLARLERAGWAAGAGGGRSEEKDSAN